MSDQAGLYRNPIHCLQQTFRDGGVTIFFKVNLLVCLLIYYFSFFVYY